MAPPTSTANGTPIVPPTTPPSDVDAIIAQVAAAAAPSAPPAPSATPAPAALASSVHPLDALKLSRAWENLGVGQGTARIVPAIRPDGSTGLAVVGLLFLEDAGPLFTHAHQGVLRAQAGGVLGTHAYNGTVKGARLDTSHNTLAVPGLEYGDQGSEVRVTFSATYPDLSPIGVAAAARSTARSAQRKNTATALRVDLPAATSAANDPRAQAALVPAAPPVAVRQPPALETRAQVIAAFKAGRITQDTFAALYAATDA